MAGIYQRGKTYYALFYVGGCKKRISLQTISLQVAKDKIRQIESHLIRGEEISLPTRILIVGAGVSLVNMAFLLRSQLWYGLKIILKTRVYMVNLILPSRLIYQMRLNLCHIMRAVAGGKSAGNSTGSEYGVLSE